MDTSDARRPGRVNRGVLVTAAVVALLALGALAYFYGEKIWRRGPGVNGGPREPDELVSREAFLAAYPVFMHPRCMNCHPAGDLPWNTIGISGGGRCQFGLPGGMFSPETFAS